METFDEYTGIEAQNDPEFAMEGWTEEEYEEQLHKLDIYHNETVCNVQRNAELGGVQKGTDKGVE